MPRIGGWRLRQLIVLVATLICATSAALGDKDYGKIMHTALILRRWRPRSQRQ